MNRAPAASGGAAQRDHAVRRARRPLARYSHASRGFCLAESTREASLGETASAVPTAGWKYLARPPRGCSVFFFGNPRDQARFAKFTLRRAATGGSRADYRDPACFLHALVLEPSLPRRLGRCPSHAVRRPRLGGRWACPSRRRTARWARSSLCGHIDGQGGLLGVRLRSLCQDCREDLGRHDPDRRAAAISAGRLLDRV